MVFNLRCRTCLCEETEIISLEERIFIDEYTTDICLLDVIKECASVEIPLGDCKPQGICKTCLGNAKISYTFRKKCEQSQVVLAQEFLNNDNIKMETNEDLLSSDDDVPLSEIKPVRCSVCGKFYKTQKSLLTHFQSHKTLLHEDDPAAFKENNDNEGILNLHEKHICHFCTKSFTVQKYYLKHMVQHAEISFEKTNGNEDFDTNKREFSIVKDELYSTSNDTLNSVISKKKRPCKKCDCVLDSHCELKEHMKTHCYTSRKGKARTCPECLATFTAHTSWLEHVRNAHASFTCRECNITSLRTIRQLKAHTARFHASGILLGVQSATISTLDNRSCDICGKMYVSKDAMFKHRRLRHGSGKHKEEQIDELRVSYCDYCQWKGRPAALAKHKMAEHADMRSVECMECKKKFFTNHSLRLHMLVHTGEKKHMCEVCGSSFALQSNLIIHKRVHTGEKPYKCDQCDKAFTQHSSLHVHKFTHTDKPTFRCDQCGATFYRKDSFRYHLKKHRSEDEWDKCEICDKKFKSRKLLKNHRVVHTGERNHQCTICEKSFGRRSSLRTHMSIHTGEKPHVCLVCGRGFLQKHVLRTHMKMHGNKLPDDIHNHIQK